MLSKTASSKNKKESPYSMHPGFAMQAAIVKNFKSRTGKTVAEWAGLVKKSGPPDAKERREWLKEKYGLTTNYAMFVVEQAEGKGGAESYNPDALVEKIFPPPKAHLRPLYEEILRFGMGLGKDVKVCPCSTIIPFYRKHVFAQVKVPNRSRIDLGFAFGDRKATGILIDTGGFAKKDRITHRVELATAEDFNSEVQSLFQRAYEIDGD